MDEAQDGSGHSKAPGSTPRGAKGVANPAGEREQKAMISKLADIDSSALDHSTLDHARGDAMLRDGSLPEGSLPDGSLAEVSEVLVKDLVKVFKLLSDETRLRILLYLSQRDELHVRALCDLLGQSQPAVSHHLALLRVAGLIESRRDGKHNFHRLLPARIQSVLDTVFASVPEQQRRIRFEDYVLSYDPASDV